MHTPVGGHEAGRYESPPVSWVDAGVFLGMHESFLERDARHDIWIAHPVSEGLTPLLVFDRHNLIYAYGLLDSFTAILRQRGFTEGTVAIPMPHNHHYHHEFNSANDAIMAYWLWHRTPLLY